MALNPGIIEALRPRAKPYKTTDGQGLYLLTVPSGARYWRFRYRWNGKQNTLSCGVYPDVSIDGAREKRDGYRAMLLQGISPSDHNKNERAKRRDEQARTLAATRFMIDNDGGLSFKLGKRSLFLTPAETSELRSFLDATRAVTPKG